jgi:hypothetical protein
MALVEAGVPAPLVRLLRELRDLGDATLVANDRADGGGEQASTSDQQLSRVGAPLPKGDSAVLRLLVEGDSLSHDAAQRLRHMLLHDVINPLSEYSEHSDDVLWLVCQRGPTTPAYPPCSPAPQGTTGAAAGSVEASTAAPDGPLLARMASRIFGRSAEAPRRRGAGDDDEVPEEDRELFPPAADGTSSPLNMDSPQCGAAGDDTSRTESAGLDAAAHAPQPEEQRARTPPPPPPPPPPESPPHAQQPQGEMSSEDWQRKLRKLRARVCRRPHKSTAVAAAASDSMMLPRDTDTDEDSAARVLALYASSGAATSAASGGNGEVGTPASPSVPEHPRLFATVALNLLCSWTYTLTVAVVRAIRLPELYGEKPAMVCVREVVKRVYAAPYKALLRTKAGADCDDSTYGASASASPRGGGGDNSVGDDDGGANDGGGFPFRSTFPVLHFNLDDFESEFGEARLTPGYHLAVLLVAGTSQDPLQAGIFRGVVSYNDVMRHMRRKYVPPLSVASPQLGEKQSSDFFDKDGNGGGADDGRVFIPLQARAGRSEVAVTVAPHDRKERKKETVAQKFFSLFKAPETPKKKGERADHGLDGDEALDCSLTHLSLHVGHVLTTLLQPPPPAVPAASGDGRQPRPWLVHAPNRDTLDEWLQRAQPPQHSLPPVISSAEAAEM